jgi:hypothetical protein
LRSTSCALIFRSVESALFGQADDAYLPAVDLACRLAADG